MTLGTTYLCVTDMQRSLTFYRALLQKEPTTVGSGRWATFQCGNTLSLYHRAYDAALLETAGPECFNDAYRAAFRREYHPNMPGKNEWIVLNFEVEDLNAEYARLKALNIGPVSELFYVNVQHPYWYFNLLDPDGNTLEITGPYRES